MGYKIYLALGFHTSFYHSWRGDTPDEAGFGTDIRVVRRILEILNQANASGLQARGYWDADVYWTFEKILPAHAPDIITGIQERVQSGQDEVVLGPYNNGANHAATEDEFRAALENALENPRGSGLRQLFGQVAPFYRPQESMQTAGQNRILLEMGIQGVVHYYAGVPFNALSTFIPTLTPEQQYNPLWMRCAPDDALIIVWPCVSVADVLNHVSLEMWLLELRRLQTSRQVNCDLLLHINFDADAESWLPFDLPRAFTWFPNSGGLVEYIQAVNKYPWAEFTLLSEYLDTHPPAGEILVRQDLADGSFDGSASWAEKFSSLQLWTTLERSRLHSYRAAALSKRVGGALRDENQRRLWKGVDSAFFQRTVGLSTTHFGMSTPVINEERQAVAEVLLGSACQIALEAERHAALELRRRESGVGKGFYTFESYNYARARDGVPIPLKMALRLPVILPKGVTGVVVRDAHGEAVRASLINVQSLPEDQLYGEITFVETYTGVEGGVYQVFPKREPAGRQSHRILLNRWIEVDFSPEAGIASLRFEGHEFAQEHFLEPFISYRSGRSARTWGVQAYSLDELEGETWDGLSRLRLRARIPMETPQGVASSDLSYTFTLYDELPYLFVDVDMRCAYTTPRESIQNIQQKLRRLVDLNWIEVAPFQLSPAITAPSSDPLRVWKHNYLGVTSSYRLNYGEINPRNKNLDAFNHQVTAGWVAVSNGEEGLLLAENAAALSSMAFCPLRLREVDGRQHIQLNPFGTYHGKQLDYSHLAGNGVGAAVTSAISSALRSSAPSFNGQRLRFSLMLAPYFGGKPPVELQNDAAGFFYPCGVFYHHTPDGVETAIPEDMLEGIQELKRTASLADQTPVPAPRAFLANPGDGTVTLVWDAPDDERLSAYELRWKKVGHSDWHTADIPLEVRWTVPDLVNGEAYIFQLRSRVDNRASAWSAAMRCIPDPVEELRAASAVGQLPFWTLLKLAYFGAIHGIVTRWFKRLR